MERRERVQVAVRLRPLLAHENGRPASHSLELHERGLVIERRGRRDLVRQPTSGARGRCGTTREARP